MYSGVTSSIWYCWHLRFELNGDNTCVCVRVCILIYIYIHVYICVVSQHADKTPPPPPPPPSPSRTGNNCFARCKNPQQRVRAGVHSCHLTRDPPHQHMLQTCSVRCAVAQMHSATVHRSTHTYVWAQQSDSDHREGVLLGGGAGWQHKARAVQGGVSGKNLCHCRRAVREVPLQWYSHLCKRKLPQLLDGGSGYLRGDGPGRRRPVHGAAAAAAAFGGDGARARGRESGKRCCAQERRVFDIAAVEFVVVLGNAGCTPLVIREGVRRPAPATDSTDVACSVEQPELVQRLQLPKRGHHCPRPPPSIIELCTPTQAHAQAQAHAHAHAMLGRRSLANAHHTFLVKPTHSTPHHSKQSSEPTVSERAHATAQHSTGTGVVCAVLAL